MDKKIIVAHPGKQHSFKIASELKKNNMLFKYITTIYDSKSSILMKLIKKVLRGDNLKRAIGRKNIDLSENDVIQFCEIFGLVEIFLARYDKKRKIYNWWQRYNADIFGKKVAQYAIKNNVDAVIMYDTNALKCFQILEKKAPHIKRVMDVSAANRIYMKKIYESDFQKCPEFADKLKAERGFLWQEKNIERLEQEIIYTQFFLAPSNFVKNSLLYSGVKEKQIYICPYGTNFKIEDVKKIEKKNEPLEAVYVGNVTEMKGIFYLLEAFKNIDVSRVHLTIVGAYNNSDNSLDDYMKQVSFTGRVTHDKVEQILRSSDFFVFSSLGEGLSLSVLEALACGLPCITTENSGANDAIDEGNNGFVVPIQNTNGIISKVNWFDKNRNKIPEMSQLALASAKKYTWENHEKCLLNALEIWLD